MVLVAREASEVHLVQAMWWVVLRIRAVERFRGDGGAWRGELGGLLSIP